MSKNGSIRVKLWDILSGVLTVGIYLDPGCPLYVARHVQQLVHVYLQLWDGLLLQQGRRKKHGKFLLQKRGRKTLICPVLWWHSVVLCGHYQVRPLEVSGVPSRLTV